MFNFEFLFDLSCLKITYLLTNLLLEDKKR